MEEEYRISLYPLKFGPLFRLKPWGGSRFIHEFGFTGVPEEPCGEAWLLSGVPGSETQVNNGPLSGNTVSEVYEVFLEELVGEKVYKASPDMFPLLIKMIDANEWLSVQVHPDDELALERHGITGKTEMWYVLEADPGAKLISGFDKELDRNTLVFLTENGILPEVLHREEVFKGDVFFTPAGRVHAIGPGILLAEIQQTSDVTYRLFDWGRVDASGKPRETHLALSLEAIDYAVAGDVKAIYQRQPNHSNPVLSCEHFTTHLILCDTPLIKDYASLDSCVVLLFTRGEGMLVSGPYTVPYHQGEVILLPAITQLAELYPTQSTEVLEVWID